MLPMDWGIWVTRYCIFEPASASLDANLMIFFYKQEPHQPVHCQTPTAMHLFTAIESDRHSSLVTLRQGRKPVAWLRMPTEHAVNALNTLLREARALRANAAPKGRFEVKDREKLLSEKETELAQREAQVCARERAMEAKEQARSPSTCADDDEEDEVPFGSSVVMDWPLSRSEKQVRLVNALDRQRIAAVATERNRAKRRFSEPPRSENHLVDRCEIRLAPEGSS